MRVDEVGRLAVVLRGARTVAAGGGDHRQAFEAIVHVGIVLEEVLGGVFGLVEAARVNQVDDDVRRLVEAVILGTDRRVWRGSSSASRASAAARSAAARSAAAASSRGRQHRLYFWPLPQGQGSLRPILAIISSEAPVVHHPAHRRDAVRRVDSPSTRSWPPPRRPAAAAAAPDASTTRIIRASRAAGPRRLSAAYETRASFCCDEGCRKRLTPASVRFLGRKVYLGPWSCCWRACCGRGPTPWRVSRLHALLGVSARTLARWHRWWRDAFVHTAFWKAARSRFARPVEADDLPRESARAISTAPPSRRSWRRCASSAR